MDVQTNGVPPHSTGLCPPLEPLPKKRQTDRHTDRQALRGRQPERYKMRNRAGRKRKMVGKRKIERKSAISEKDLIKKTEDRDKRDREGMLIKDVTV